MLDEYGKQLAAAPRDCAIHRPEIGSVITPVQTDFDKLHVYMLIVCEPGRVDEMMAAEQTERLGEVQVLHISMPFKDHTFSSLP